MKMSWLAVAVMFVALASQPGLAVDKQKLMAANAAVEANLKTPEGKQYEEKLGVEFPQQFLPALRQCKQSVGSFTDLDMFLKLAADGKVEEVLVYPENAFTTCARNGVAGGKLSGPPHGDYWVNIHLQGKH